MINTELFKSTMQKIYEKVAAEKELLLQSAIPLKGETEDDNIDNLMNAAKDTSFKLLIMGKFSSGKSSFINVLLGEKLLPVKALPTTALITEIYYGREKKVIMYPRPGKWKGGNEPFEIEPSLTEIAKYSTLNNKSGINTKEANRVDSCFEKMVVYWPLEMLKDGVSIIDSPGTDDPYSNDYIVEEYVPKADAILYCINGMQAYSMNDKNTLARLNSRGFKPIIVTTYFDVVTDGLSDEEITDFLDTTYSSFYSNHTTKDCCHYVNSLLGLHGKEQNIHSELVESGYFELEKFLGEYLTEYKGKEKISIVTSRTKIYNENQKKQIKNIIANLGVPQQEFEKRMADAEKKLEQAKLQGELLTREFKLELKSARAEVDSLIPSLYQTLYDNVDLSDFEPDTSFSIWHPKKSSQQIAEECSKELELRNKNAAAEWCNDVLTPKLTQSFENIIKKMKAQFDTFDNDIRRVNITLSTEQESVNVGVGSGTKVGMFAYALLTGDWLTALLGGVFGASTFGKTLICQFVAGVVLGIVSLFTPVGLAGLVIASLGAVIGGVGWNAMSAASSIKNQTVKSMRKALAEDKDKIIGDAQVECTKTFTDAENKLQEAINADIQGVESNIVLIQKEREENLAQAEQRKKVLTSVTEHLTAVNTEMDQIRKELHI